MIILFGPAGSGKSTQGRTLADLYGWRWLSVGQVLRDSGEFDAQIEDSFEYYEDEGKTVGNIKTSQENLAKIEAFKSKLGGSVAKTIELIDKVAA